MVLTRKLKRLSNWISERPFKFLPKKIRRKIALASLHAESHVSPRDMIFFLLHLDLVIYKITSLKSSEYNGGCHLKHRLTGYHDFFVTRIRPGECVIDIGCGKREIAYRIAAEAGGSVVGIDHNEQRLKHKRENYQHPEIKFILGDVEEIIPAGKFDTVILSNVIEHIENKESFLQRIKKRLRPVRSLKRVPVFNRDWRVPLRMEFGLPYFLDETHFTEYTQESFEQEMVSAGLCVNHLEIRWGEIWAEVVPDA